MGKMKDLAIEKANEEHGSWQEMQDAINLDDEYHYYQYDLYSDEIKALDINKRIFVYGTLMNGYANNRLLYKSKFIGKAITKKQHKFSGAGIPFMHKEEDNNGGVYGEIFEIDSPETLYSLDFLEGHPTLYKRELTEVIINEKTESVWTYFINGTYWNTKYIKAPKDFRKLY